MIYTTASAPTIRAASDMRNSRLQQRLSTLHPAAHLITMRGLAKRLLECSREMEGAQLHEGGEIPQQDFLIELFFDVICNFLLLPTCEPSTQQWSD